MSSKRDILIPGLAVQTTAATKRYLLIFLIIVWVCLLGAQPRFSLQTGIYTDEDTDLRLRNRLSINGSLNPSLHWETDSDLYRADGFSGPQQQVLIHDGRASLSYRASSLELKAGYANTLFDDSALMTLYPSWRPAYAYKRLMAHQSMLAGDWDTSGISVAAFGIHRYLRVEPYVFDFGDFEFHPQPKTGYSDLYAGLELGYKISDAVAILASYDQKAGFYADDDPYDLNAVKLSCEVSLKPWTGGRLEAAFGISHRNSDAIDPPRANLVQTRIRYQHNFMPGLSGFITWENNSCFADSLDAIYLISNYLRPQLVYSLPYDDSAISYLRVGGKYSPENEANTVFADAEAQIWKGIYAGLGAAMIPERLEQYTGALLYRFSTSEIGLRYQHREFKIYPGKTDYWGLETRLYW